MPPPQPPSEFPKCWIADGSLDWESQQLDFEQYFSYVEDYRVFKGAGFYHCFALAFSCQRGLTSPHSLFVPNHFTVEIDRGEVKDIICGNCGLRSLIFPILSGSINAFVWF